MPWVLHRERPDVFHAPHYVLPPATRMPLGRHDSRLHSPDVPAIPAEPRGVRVRLGVDVDCGPSGRTGFSRSRRRPSGTSCTSSRCRPEKIVVVYNAIDERFRTRAVGRGHGPRARALPARARLRAVRRQHQASQEPRPAHRGVRHAAPSRLRRAEAAHHRRRDLEAAGVEARRPHAQAAQARPLSRLSAGRDARRSCTGSPRCSCFRRSTKASVCRPWRRWRAAPRSSPRTSRRCRRSPAMPPYWSIPYDVGIDCRGHAPRSDRCRAERRASAPRELPAHASSRGSARSPERGSSIRKSEAATENRADSRLAHRHARRRTRARGFVRAASRRRHLHAVSRPRLRLAGHRATSHRARPSCSACPARRRTTGSIFRSFRFAIEQFDLDRYDLVISSSHCAAKAVVPRRPGAARLLLPLADAVRVGSIRCVLRTRARGTLREPMGLPAPDGASGAMGRGDDRRASHRFVANSAHVAARIRRYYNREATIVYPPVDTVFFHPADITAGHALSDRVRSRSVQAHRAGHGGLREGGCFAAHRR